MGVPFFMVVAFAIQTDVEKEIGDYRLREGVKSVLAIPKIRLIEEIGILEKEIGETDYYIDIAGEDYRLNDFDDISLNEESDSVRLDFVLGNQSVMKKIKVVH